MLKKLLTAALSTLSLLPYRVLAITIINNPLNTANPSQPITGPQLYARFAALIFTLSGVMALVVIVYGAVLMLTSRGEEEKIEKGKMMIFWAVVGLIVIGSAYVIAQFIVQTANKGVLVKP